MRSIIKKSKIKNVLSLIAMLVVIGIAGLIGGRFIFENKNSENIPLAGRENISQDFQQNVSLPVEIEKLPDFISYDVPFTAQAPFGNWNDPRQQNGCEEAAALMAMRWVEDRGLMLNDAEKEIIAISDYELKTYGDFHDTSVKDTVARIFNGYFGYSNVVVKYDIGVEDIKRELAIGNLVIVSVNGQKLQNPFYTLPGPERHMLLIRGYDDAKKEFITNDAGTRRGNGLRYSYSILASSLRDYKTGFHEPFEEVKTAMIVTMPR